MTATVSARAPTQGLALAPEVHAVRVRDDIVFLDVAADAYLCLAGAAPHITLGLADLTTDDPGLADQLRGAGLVQAAGAPAVARQPPPPLPKTSCRLLAPTRARPSLSVLLTALRVTGSVMHRFPKANFADLLSGPRAAPEAAEPPSRVLVEAVAQFEQLRPWLPAQGECLLRSYHLRAFLRARGFDALWVFGVRTWPFGAHCWLQAGDTVLDDDLERLAAYQPILAV